MNEAKRSELDAPLCSHDFIPRLPVTPTKEEIMLELERMIHQWDDSPRPESAHGYHRDALWLEEVRHIIATQDKEIEKLRVSYANAEVSHGDRERQPDTQSIHNQP